MPWAQAWSIIWTKTGSAVIRFFRCVRRFIRQSVRLQIILLHHRKLKSALISLVLEFLFSYATELPYKRSVPRSAGPSVCHVYFWTTNMAIFEVEKASNDFVIVGTIIDYEVVASNVPRSTCLSLLASFFFSPSDPFGSSLIGSCWAIFFSLRMWSNLVEFSVIFLHTRP